MRLPEAAQRVATAVWRDGYAAGERVVPEETPVALTYNRLTHAVMMATPADLEDFAVGFSRSEGIIDQAADLEEVAVIATELGVECRMWIGAERMARLEARRRVMAGPTGCGLCGLESLAETLRVPPPVTEGGSATRDDIFAALAAMAAAQTLNHATRSVHAAGFWCAGRGLVAVREDVGRHNALDKLSGALARAGVAAAGGLVVMTSRISVELVQKVAAMGAPILVAISAPTRLALQTAERAGVTLVGVARRDGFEIFTHAQRVEGATFITESRDCEEPSRRPT